MRTTIGSYVDPIGASPFPCLNLQANKSFLFFKMPQVKRKRGPVMQTPPQQKKAEQKEKRLVKYLRASEETTTKKKEPSFNVLQDVLRSSLLQALMLPTYQSDDQWNKALLFFKEQQETDPRTCDVTAWITPLKEDGRETKEMLSPLWAWPVCFHTLQQWHRDKENEELYQILVDQKLFTIESLNQLHSQTGESFVRFCARQSDAAYKFLLARHQRMIASLEILRTHIYVAIENEDDEQAHMIVTREWSHASAFDIILPTRSNGKVTPLGHAVARALPKTVNAFLALVPAVDLNIRFENGLNVVQWSKEICRDNSLNTQRVYFSLYGIHTQLQKLPTLTIDALTLAIPCMLSDIHKLIVSILYT